MMKNAIGIANNFIFNDKSFNFSCKLLSSFALAINGKSGLSAFVNNPFTTALILSPISKKATEFLAILNLLLISEYLLN